MSQVRIADADAQTLPMLIDRCVGCGRPAKSTTDVLLNEKGIVPRGGSWGGGGGNADPEGCLFLIGVVLIILLVVGLFQLVKRLFHGKAEESETVTKPDRLADIKLKLPVCRKHSWFHPSGLKIGGREANAFTLDGVSKEFAGEYKVLSVGSGETRTC